jgi:hypothetical protein
MKRVLSIAGVVVAVIAVVVIVMVVLGGGSGEEKPRAKVGTPPAKATPDPTEANLWIVPGGGPCDGGRSAEPIRFDASESPDRRCGSIPEAYAAAKPGDKVCFADGTYKSADLAGADPDSQIAVKPKPAGPDVVFDSCGSDKVDMTEAAIDIREGAYMEFRNLKFHDFYLRGAAQHITFRGITAQCSFIRGADHVRLLDSTMGDTSCVSFWSARTNEAPGFPIDNADAATDLLIDNVTWHDVWSAGPGDHTDSLAIDYVKGIKIRRLTMVGCENACLIFGNGAGGQPGASDIEIENSAFACCFDAFKCEGKTACNVPGGNSVVFFQDNNPSPVTFRFNSVSSHNGAFRITDATGPDPRDARFVIDSNVFDSEIGSPNCELGATWRNNISASGTPCAGENKVAPPGWTHPPQTCCEKGYGWDGKYDFHLEPGAAAIGFGNRREHPETDRDGTARGPGAVDAGAFAHAG